MSPENVYGTLVQLMYAGVYANAKDGKQISRFASAFFQEHAPRENVQGLAAVLVDYNNKYTSPRKAADFMPHCTMLQVLCESMIAVPTCDTVWNNLLDLSNKGVVSYHANHFTSLAIIDSLGAKMDTITKENIGSVIFTLSKCLRDASDADKKELGLKASSEAEEYIGKAIELILTEADDNLHATVKAFSSMGEMIFDAPVAHDVMPIVERLMKAHDSKAEATESAPAGFTPITVKPEFGIVLNNMLAAATGSKLNTFDEVNAVFIKAAALEEEVHKLQTKLRSAPKMMAVAPVATPEEEGIELTCVAETVEAADIFTRKGKKSKALKFELPRFIWSGKHKDVPEIDTGYEFRLSYLLGLLPALRDNKNVWLFGHTGTGKSTLVQEVAGRLGWPVTRVNLDSGIERSDLIGKTELVIEDGKQITKYVEGLVVYAMRNGHILLLDEVDFGRSDVMYVLQRVLEGNGIQLMEGEKRELVKPHPNFRIVATANTRGQGDELGLYQGAMVQSEAYRDRFHTWIEVEYLDAEQERDVLLSHVPELKEDVANKMIQMAGEIRKAFTSGEILQTISPRALIEMGRSYCFYSDLLDDGAAMMLAIELTVINKAASDSQAVIKELAKRVFA